MIGYCAIKKGGSSLNPEPDLSSAREILYNGDISLIKIESEDKKDGQI